MGARRKSGFWRFCRICFRRFRICLWLSILLLLGGLVYLNQIGLPGFVKRPLLEKLRAQGLDLQFSRLRLRWYEGIVAENVRFGRVDEALSPQLTAAELRVGVNSKALRRFQLQVDSVTLWQGKFSWPIQQGDKSIRTIAIENIETELRFLPNDLWALDNFRATFAGAQLRLSGLLTNASAVRDWKLLQGEAAGPAHADVWQHRLRGMADTVAQIHFAAQPELLLNLQGDARDLQSFSALLLVSAPAADTPWGSVSCGRLTGRVFPATMRESSRVELQLQAADAQSRWANMTNFSLNMRLSSVEVQTNLINGRLEISAKEVQTSWCTGDNAIFTAQWLQALTNPIPVSGQASFQCEQPKTRWGEASHFELSAQLINPLSHAVQVSVDSSWGWWSNLQPYSISWDGKLADFRSPKINLDQISCGGTWFAPHLVITNLTAALYGGQFAASGELDVVTRNLHLGVSSDFDPHHLAPLLPGVGRFWLEQFVWNTAPELSGQLWAVLPAWNNPRPDWRVEVQPTVRLEGEFNLPGRGAFREIEVTSACSHFVYSNLCWYLPDLTVTRPEGTFEASHRANDLTQDFYWQISSSVDPRILEPLLDEAQRSVFDLFTFTEPPRIEAEVWGRFSEPQRMGISGQVALTNFTFRNESISGLQTSVQFTNQFLKFLAPQIQVGAQHVSADGLCADFGQQYVFLTNGFSDTDPGIIARAIGPDIWRAIEPYRFLSPPTGHVYGTIPMHGEEGADLHFELDGGPFHWWKFKLPHIAGHVHWSGLHLTLSDIGSDFYDGKLAGSAAFDFSTPHKTSLEFNAAVTNALLQGLMADLVTASNHLEGRLGGRLVITKADTDSLHSVSGFGDLQLRDGLIWDIPLFGIFTPVLNGISPGLGNSRANAGTSSFIITTGVLRSNDLEIRSAAMRLLYHGTVDLDGNLNARVDAELLRDVWGVGPLVSTLFWPVTKMFEYKVTGALDEPKSEPVFIVPKLITLPFRPFHTLKGPALQDQNPPAEFSPVPP